MKGEEILLKGHRCPYKDKKIDNGTKKKGATKKRKTCDTNKSADIVEEIINTHTATSKKKKNGGKVKISRTYTVGLRFPGGLVVQLRGNEPITKKQIIAVESLVTLEDFQKRDYMV